MGQRSTATIKNAVFINCDKGVAVKDSSNVLINRSVFYNNVDAVACFEKNLGSAGGNAVIINSILSNSSNKPLFVDAKSTLQSAYCLTDFATDTSYPLNLQGNPEFTNPTFFDFLEDNKKEKITEFVKFVRKELQLEKCPTIVLQNGRGELKTTANYDYSKENKIIRVNSKFIGYIYSICSC